MVQLRPNAMGRVVRLPCRGETSSRTCRSRRRLRSRKTFSTPSRPSSPTRESKRICTKPPPSKALSKSSSATATSSVGIGTRSCSTTLRSFTGCGTTAAGHMPIDEESAALEIAQPTPTCRLESRPSRERSVTRRALSTPKTPIYKKQLHSASLSPPPRRQRSSTQKLRRPRTRAHRRRTPLPSRPMRSTRSSKIRNSRSLRILLSLSLSHHHPLTKRTTTTIMPNLRYRVLLSSYRRTRKQKRPRRAGKQWCLRGTIFDVVDKVLRQAEPPRWRQRNNPNPKCKLRLCRPLKRCQGRSKHLRTTRI